MIVNFDFGDLQLFHHGCQFFQLVQIDAYHIGRAGLRFDIFFGFRRLFGFRGFFNFPGFLNFRVFFGFRWLARFGWFGRFIWRVCTGRCCRCDVS